MDQLHPDSTLVPLLQQIVTPQVNYHLFTNPVPSDLTAVLGSFTEEVVAGYAPIGVPVGSFTMNGVTGGQGFIIAPDIGFPNTSGVDMVNYGYFITDQSNTIFLAFAVFDGGPRTTPSGSTLTVTPRFGNQSKYTT